MENVDKKEALRNILKDVRNAHGLIYEYDLKMLHLLEYLVGNLIKGEPDIHKYPYTYIYKKLKVKKFDTIWNPHFIELFFEKDEKVFSIIVSTGNTENEKSELIFILDEKRSFLKQDPDKKEDDFTNIINEDKTVLEKLEQKGCKILRKNIEDFYDEAAVKKEWEESIRSFLTVDKITD